VRRDGEIRGLHVDEGGNARSALQRFDLDRAPQIFGLSDRLDLVNRLQSRLFDLVKLAADAKSLAGLIEHHWCVPGSRD